MVTHHPPDIEVFHADRLVFTEQLYGSLVQEVGTLVMYCLMYTGHFDPLFIVIVATLLFTGEPTLFPGKLFKGGRQVFRVTEFIPVTVRVKVRESHIKAYGPVGHSPGFELKIYKEYGVVLVRGRMLHGNAVYTAYVHGLSNTHIADFREFYVFPDYTDVVALVDCPVGLPVVMF